MRRALLGLSLALTVIVQLGWGQVEKPLAEPLPRAHAHNDYAHDRPLLDALQHGFCSIEADVFLVQGELLVGHTRFELRPQRTLKALYLDPLKQHLEQSGERVFPGGPSLTLLVDIKTDGERAYQALDKLLAEYDAILTSYEEGKVTPRAITVVISGDRPIDYIAGQKRRWAAIDGRLSDLAGEAPSHLIPLISDNWRSHFQWRGTGPMPEDERARLQELVAKAHRQGRTVRFWATPESTAVWDELHAAGVDFIGTDDLAALAKFLAEKM